MLLYLIHDGTYTKIGITDNWRKRLHTIQTGNPHDLLTRALFNYDSIPDQAVKDLEKRLHTQLRNFHRRGEWFLLPEEIIDRIAVASPIDLLNNQISFRQ